MRPSLDDLLKVLDPFVPHELVAAQVRANICNVAGRLPPIYHGGLECRLLRGQQRVDLHQSIQQDNGEPQLLVEHIEQSGWVQHAGWKQLAHICRHWCRPGSSLHQCLAEIWLEFDIRAKPRDVPVPSIFLQLQPPVSGSRFPDDLVADVLEALASDVGPSDLGALQTALMGCAGHCPPGARVTHIGLMLARKPEKIRININGLTRSQWPQFLHAIDWPGSVSDLSALLDPLYDRLANLNFCIDVGRHTAPGLGLECLVHAGANRRDAWAIFLERLTGDGMVSPEKGTAVLNWENIIKPPDAPQRWPGDLIVESLLRGPDCFSLVSQAINHIKIVYHPSHPPAAKAYLWFGHQWAERRDIEFSTTRRAPGRRTEATDES